jgi:hypothetical protein
MQGPPKKSVTCSAGQQIPCFYGTSSSTPHLQKQATQPYPGARTAVRIVTLLDDREIPSMVKRLLFSVVLRPIKLPIQ